MYCEKCGQQLSDGTVFCTMCGNKTGNAAGVLNLKTNEVRKLDTIKEKIVKLPLIAIIAAIAIVAGGLIALVLGLDQGSPAYQEGKQYIEDFADANKKIAEDFDELTDRNKIFSNTDNELLTTFLITGLSILLLGLLFIIYYRIRKKASYTPIECSICNKPTGIEGNKRSEHFDGFVCESCLKAANKNPENIE